jgi:hypothetical protein
LEEGNKFNVTQDAIRKREEEFLVTLREMKESILKDKQAENAGGNNNVASSSSNELVSLREENDRLKAKMTKQEYRISHLVTGMEKLFEQQKKE